MSITLTPTETHPFILNFNPILKKISDEDFFEFCQLNREWRIERTRDGELIVMPMRGGTAGARSFTLTGIFGIWVRTDGTGGVWFIDRFRASSRRDSLAFSRVDRDISLECSH